MNHNYHSKLEKIWKDAVNRYELGKHSPDGFLSEEELQFLASIGMNVMDVFDFAEDWVCEGTPDLATFLMIHEDRKSVV